MSNQPQQPQLPTIVITGVSVIKYSFDTKENVRSNVRITGGAKSCGPKTVEWENLYVIPQDHLGKNSVVTIEIVGHYVNIKNQVISCTLLKETDYTTVDEAIEATKRDHWKICYINRCPFKPESDVWAFGRV